MVGDKTNANQRPQSIRVIGNNRRTKRRKKQELIPVGNKTHSSWRAPIFRNHCVFNQHPKNPSCGRARMAFDTIPKQGGHHQKGTASWGCPPRPRQARPRKQVSGDEWWERPCFGYPNSKGFQDQHLELTLRVSYMEPPHSEVVYLCLDAGTKKYYPFPTLRQLTGGN